jgi:abortive infection bacteriophage resistance protein
LEHSVYVRNLCAHHARLWNRRFTVTLQLPRSSPASILPNLYPQQDRRLYNTLVVLTHMVAVIEPNAHWPHRLTHHLLTLKPQLLPQMGFPLDWQKRPLWAPLVQAATHPSPTRAPAPAAPA